MNVSLNFGNDLFITITSDEDVRDFRDYLDAYLRIKAKSTTQKAVAQSNGYSNSYNAFTHQLAQTITQPHDRLASRKQATLERYKHALRELGGRGTGDQVLKKMLELGYEMTAENPRTAVTTYMRQDPEHFRKVELSTTGAAIYEFKDTEDDYETISPVSRELFDEPAQEAHG